MLCDWAYNLEIINSAINTKVNNIELSNFVDKAIANSFEFDFFNLMAPMIKEFFYDGFTTDVYVPKDKIEEFINKNKKQLNQWGMELLKKINQHENFQKLDDN